MQGQVVALSRTGFRFPTGDAPSPMPLGQIGILAWYAAKDIQYRDAVEFSETERDFYGMPAMRIRYTITDVDRETLALQRANVERSAKAVGDLLTEPTLAAGGSSLHYQGTVRMGVADDGESVCDPYAGVWGVDHLYVGGNGLIPTATAANPTLTNVALAVRAAGRLAAEL
jgi:choline dehydrogenase-like flavoprotein